MKAAKKILKYLKGTGDLVLFNLSGDNFDLTSYADVDNVRCLVDKKSTSGDSFPSFFSNFIDI